MKLTADTLNHLLRQNPWASAQLRPFSGKVIRISMQPFATTLAIANHGEFTPASGAVPDAEIILTAGAAMRMLVEGGASSGMAAVQGDAELAAVVGKVLHHLQWDAEADLSKLIGDIPAHELTQAASRIRGKIGRQALSLAGMLSEFWQEEQPQIAKQHHLEQFSHEVDALRDDVERLAKRIERLESNL